MSKAEMLAQPKKQSKSGKRNQKMFLRKFIAKKLKMPASDFKYKTFEELKDIYFIVNSGDLEGAKIFLDIQKDLPRMSAEEREKWNRENLEEEDMSRGLRKQRGQIKKKVEEATGLPSDIADIISLMAEDPSVRVKKGSSKKVLKEILEDAGASEMLEIAIKEGDYTDREGRPITRVSELTDKNISDILEDFPDLKDMIDPTIRDRTPELKELKSLRESLRKKPSVIREREEEEKYMTKEIREIFRDEEEEEKYEKDTMQAVRMSQEEPVKQKYETEKMDDDDRFSDNFFRGVNSYGSFIPNQLVPERQRNMSIRSEILQESRNMRNDPDVLVQPPQNILEQNRILEGPDDVMPESEVEPQNPARVNYEMSVASNNMHSMEQNVLDRNARNVRIAQRRILGEEADDDEFGEDLEVEMKEEQEEKYDPYLLVREDESREQSFLNNKARLDTQIEELSLASQSRRNQTRGKQAHYQREAMSKLKATDKMEQMNIDALRKKEIQWKRPTRTYAGNSVGLVRQSNRSMALLSHQLLP
ncbi:MAG: hypothetical protein CMJ25_02275 [Phycisphaerae bacterium]|nr:hypothetical protein [Phycisphaerae bacterium]